MKSRAGAAAELRALAAAVEDGTAFVTEMDACAHSVTVEIFDRQAERTTLTVQEIPRRADAPPTAPTPRREAVYLRTRVDQLTKERDAAEARLRDVIVVAKARDRLAKMVDEAQEALSTIVPWRIGHPGQWRRITLAEQVATVAREYTEILDAAGVPKESGPGFGMLLGGRIKWLAEQHGHAKEREAAVQHALDAAGIQTAHATPRLNSRHRVELLTKERDAAKTEISTIWDELPADAERDVALWVHVRKLVAAQDASSRSEVVDAHAALTVFNVPGRQSDANGARDYTLVERINLLGDRGARAACERDQLQQRENDWRVALEALRNSLRAPDLVK